MSVQDEKVKFAQEVLGKLGISPQNTGALQKFVAWENQEGGNWSNSARYNPLNTTLSKPGAGNTGTQGNIKVYTSWQQGVEATVQTLKAPAYRSIVATLGSDASPALFEEAVNASPWGTQFPGHGNGVIGTVLGAVGTAGKAANEAPANLAKEAAKALGFSWEASGEFALKLVLLLVGAVLVIYGIMVAVKPAGSGAPMPVPVPV